MSSFIKTTSIAIVAITAVGILSHDMHIDRATTVALSLTAVTAGASAYEKVISQNYHTHVERASIPRLSTLPGTQPPRDDDRKYIQNKKLLFIGGGDTTSLWPSV